MLELAELVVTGTSVLALTPSPSDATILGVTQFVWHGLSLCANSAQMLSPVELSTLRVLYSHILDSREHARLCDYCAHELL